MSEKGGGGTASGAENLGSGIRATQLQKTLSRFLESTLKKFPSDEIHKYFTPELRKLFLDGNISSRNFSFAF